ncbi:retrovirus-related pol polyprotein from transposon TNT 1-94 [Tanacetum coccineum]
MSSSSKSTHDYSRKLRRAILEPWRQSHNLPPSPPPNRNTPTSPSITNSSPSLSPSQNQSPNQITHELHHLSNLLEINLQQAIYAINPSPPTSPCIPSPSLDQTELEKYMAFTDRTVDYDKLELVKQKHEELVKQSLLTKSHYEGPKEKTKVITDLKLKEARDIDKMISMEKQLKFLNEIVYKRNQSIQTIHMLAPKGLTFNGRPTFANLMYLKKDQSKKPCLYEIPYDKSNPANRFVPDREETPTLEKESRSKLNKDLLAHANEVRKKTWRKSFVKSKPKFFKNIDFLPVSKSISKSRQAYNVMTNNINHFRELVDQAWEKHSHDHFRAPTAHDMEILIKTCLMPLAIKTQNDSFTFVHELKQEMHADLKYVESLEKEIDELESDKAEFSNMYDILLQECVSNDVMCSYLHSLSDLDAHTELQCLYLHKVKECECLAQKLSKQTETIPIGQKFSPNKSFVVYLKSTPPRSGLTWKPTGRIFTQVGLKWIPIRKPVETRYNMNDNVTILLPLWTQDPPFSSSLKDSPDARFKPSREEEKKDAEDPGKDSEIQKDNAVDENIVYGCADDPNIHELEDIVYSDDDEDVGAEADMNNLDVFMPVSPIPTTRIHKDHPVEQIIGDLNLVPQTRRMKKNLKEHEEPKTVVQALKDLSWIKAIQEELLQFKLQEVRIPNGKQAIGTKWVFRNKKDERGIVIKNKARLVTQGHTQEEEIDFDEVFDHVSRIETIRLFLAYALFKDFVVYQMDVKSAFLYRKIKEEVYICQPPGFEDPDFPDRVYKVEKALYGLHQAPRACDFKTASTPMEIHKPLLKDAYGEDVDEHLYRSMIGSLMYLTSLRPDIMFVYPKDSPYDLVAFTDSDYAGANLDRKSTIGGRQFLRCRLISWQCKKQTVVVNSTTEAEYITTKIHIDNESTICIVKNPVFHSKTKHIEIRHHFIRDSNEKKLIQMIKIHTDQNVANLLTKAFDVTVAVTIAEENVDFAEIVDFLDANPIRYALTNMGEGSGQPTDPQHTSTCAQPSNEEPITVQSSSQPKKTHRPMKAKRATEISTRLWTNFTFCRLDLTQSRGKTEWKGLPLLLLA